MSVTIKSIAKLAGVSIGTVDRALNNRGRIDPEVSKQIKEIARTLNYRPNKIAKSLAIRKRKLKIAVILNTYNNLFFEDVLKGVEIAREEIKDFGIYVFIKKCKDFDFQFQLSLIDQSIEEGFNAIVIVPIYNDSIKKRLAELHSGGFPIVFLTSIIDSKDYLSYVGCNYYNAGVISAGLLNLISKGFGNLLIFSPTFQMLGPLIRVESLKKHLSDNYPNIKLKSVIEMSQDDNHNYEITRKAFLKYNDTDLLICPGANSSNGIINAIKDIGHYGKIKIISYDISDIVKEGLLDGGITAAVIQNPREQGYKAIKILFEYLVTNIAPENNNYIQTRIIIRENVPELE